MDTPTIFVFIFYCLVACRCWVHTKGSCNNTRLLEGFFLEGSVDEVLLRRVLRRHLVRACSQKSS